MDTSIHKLWCNHGAGWQANKTVHPENKPPEPQERLRNMTGEGIVHGGQGSGPLTKLTGTREEFEIEHSGQGTQARVEVKEFILPRVVVTRTKSSWLVDQESRDEGSAKGD